MTDAEHSDRQQQRRGPGRPRGAGAVSNEELLDRAINMLAHGGYPALSMRGLAREVGVSLATVQHRFATKEVLWRAAIDRLIEPPVDDHIPTGADFVESMRRRVATSAEHPGLIPSLLADDSPGHEDRSAYLARRLRPSTEAARALIAGAQDAGIVRDVDGGVLLAILMVGVAAVVALPMPLAEMLGIDGHLEDGRLADGISDILIHGIVQRGNDLL